MIRHRPKPGQVLTFERGGQKIELAISNRRELAIIDRETQMTVYEPKDVYAREIHTRIGSRV